MKTVFSKVIFEIPLLVLYRPDVSNYLLGLPRTQKLEFGCSITTRFDPMLYFYSP